MDTCLVYVEVRCDVCGEHIVPNSVYLLNIRVRSLRCADDLAQREVGHPVFTQILI